MRIIAGEYRGRRLKTLPGLELRPTSDKLRETLFNILQTELPGSVFIDCYAGSGAVGLEAVSRGALQVYLIEQDPDAVRMIEQNAIALQASDRMRILRGEARACLRKLAVENVRANICFLDPPYTALADAVRCLDWLASHSLMAPDGLLILEHARRDSTPLQVGSTGHLWSRTRLLQQGSSALSFYRSS
jgi:16S rRNA (guanine966-N2)-methyltransferase